MPGSNGACGERIFRRGQPLANYLEKIFPELSKSSYRVTSPSTIDYNCAAWAASDDTRCWWPSPVAGYYWPDGVPAETTEEAFVAAYASLGYKPCDDGDAEPGVEKIAIYVDSRGAPAHVARQLKDGRWTSKIGDYEDIEHGVVEDLQGTEYGQVSRYMQRRVT